MSFQLGAASAVAALVAGAAIFLSRSPSITVGDQAPTFSATGSDGKTYTLKSLISGGPCVFYFISNTCPINGQAVKYYNSLYSAYKGKANFIGVIDGDLQIYKDWNSRFKAPYPVLLDPDLKIIRGFKAERSPWLIMVDQKGKVAKTWHGYSVSFLKELNTGMAQSAKSSLKSVSFTGAPTDAAFG